MKRHYNTFIYALVAGFLLFTSSCKPDECKKVNCAFSSVCQNGKCICEIGYEGVQCEIASRDKFVTDGTYLVNETGSFTPPSKYTAVIVNGPRNHEVLIKNLRNGILAGEEVLATTSNDTMIIPSQIVNNHRIQGMGIIKGRSAIVDNPFLNATIEMTYSVTDLNTNIKDEYGATENTTSFWDKN
jgi:hypothetical protein